MATINDSRREMQVAGEKDMFPASALQLQLAAGIVEKLIERNGGSKVTNVFWDDDAFGSPEDEEEYLEPELWDPDVETLPEAKEIEWNIYECN